MPSKFYYYYYSKTQEKQLIANMKKLGEGLYKPKKVLYNSDWHPYTQKLLTDNIIVEDAVIVAKGSDLIIRD